MTEREIYEKFDKLSEEELNTKSNKNVFVKNVTMTNITKHCRGKKKKRCKSIRSIHEKVDGSRLWNSWVSRIWSQIKTRGIVYELKIFWRIFY